MLFRSSGILLPIFSLPSRFGIGDFGPGAFRFVDVLHAAGQRVWQILPLNPTGAAFGHSPYHSPSCFAFNPILISPDILAQDGLIDRADLNRYHPLSEDRVDYASVSEYKGHIVDKACRRFQQRLPDSGFQRFCTDNTFWLPDYALFCAISECHADRAWNRWPKGIRYRKPDDMARLRGTFHDRIETLKIEQYLIYCQWRCLLCHCREKSIHLVGDMPIYVPFHSADVWAHRTLFRLDRFHHPLGVSGVPPDYFSADGQLWGHPVYNWETLIKTRHDWWVRRFAHQMAIFDAVRVDHFRGLVPYWEVPAGETKAKAGRWVDVPAEDFFTELRRQFMSLPVIAEDLGHITADVRETMQKYGFPGMRVLLFGFSGNPSTNPNAIQNIPEQSVVYTGTHDNNTSRGWFETEASREEKRRMSICCGHRITARNVAWALIRLAMISPARWSILPVQDVLGADSAERINTPGLAQGNWIWRMTPEQLDALPADRLREMTAASGRA